MTFDWRHLPDLIMASLSGGLVMHATAGNLSAGLAVGIGILAITTAVRDSK